MEVVDAHAHLAPRPGAAADLLGRMDALGIARAVVVAGGTVSPLALSAQIALGGGQDVDVDNHAVLAACRESRGRLVPFYFANPHRGAGPYAREGRAYAGLKLGPAVHGVALDDPRTAELVETARDFGHPVYLHCLGRPGFGVAELVALAERFAEVRFILGHAGVGHCDFYGLSLIAPHDNIWLETSGGFSAVVAAAFAQLGAARVIFGSEYPLSDCRLELDKVSALASGEAERALALGGNITALLEGTRA